MKKRGLFLIFFLIFPLVSAGIIFQDNFENTYNLGDRMSLNFSLETLKEKSGFLEVSLDCSENMLVHKSFYNFKKGEKEYFNFEFPLVLKGNCGFIVSFDDYFLKSENFFVSDDILIDYNLNDNSFYPGEIMRINGSVKKDNGEFYEGIVKLELGDVYENFIDIKKGNFEYDIVLKENLAPGKYLFKVSVEEEYEDLGLTNRGSEREFIFIESKPTRIEIISEETINVSKKYFFNFSLLDQVGNEFIGDPLIVNLYNSNNDLVYKGEVVNNSGFDYFFESNAVKGRWKVNAHYGSLFSSKSFYVEENREIEINYEDDYILFKNIGNVPYQGNYKILLENKEVSDMIFVNLSLDINESYKYPLGDFSGDYNLSVGTKNFMNVHLTGYSFYEDLAGDSILEENKGYFILGFVVLILIGALISLIIAKKYKKKNKKFPIIDNKNDLKKISFKEKIKGIFFSKKKLNKKNKIFRKFIKDNNEDPNESAVFKEIVSSKKVIYYLLFMHSENNFEGIDRLIINSGFGFKKITSNLGYVLVSPKSFNTSKEIYDLSRRIFSLAHSKGEKISIALSRGHFEKTPENLKKFAALSRGLLDYSKGSILMTKKFYQDFGLKLPCQERKIIVGNSNVDICLLGD